MNPRYELRSLLDPKSIAIVGASPKPGSFGGAVLANLARHYAGRAYGVNPRYDRVGEYACYACVQDLPEVPDCVGIAVPAAGVEAALREAASGGVRNAIVFSSGFSELGSAEGAALQHRIARIAQQENIRVLGPNCTGMVNVRSGAACNILPSVRDLPMVPGGVGLVGQSGALGYVVFQAMHRGVGFSHLVSTGNSCDVDIADLIDYLVDDEQTRSIACVFESVPDGRRLRAALQRAFDAGKPVIAYKIGVTASGSKAALSHSGMLAGDAAAYAALFERTGVIAVDAFEALLETAVFFSRAGRPQGRAIGILSGSGGSVVMAADKADGHGVALPAPGAQTVEALSRRLPDFAAIANPADITAESIRDEAMYAECVKIFAADPAFASTAILMPSAHGEAAIARARGLDALASVSPRPLTLVWMNEWYEGIGSSVYDASSHLSVFRSLDRCMAAYRAWFDNDRIRRESAAPAPAPVTASQRAQARAFLQGFAPGSVLTERQSKQLFAFYGVDTVAECVCTTRQAAIEAAQSMGFPVVAKIEAAAIRHKSDMGGVVLDLHDGAAVGEAYDAILAAAGCHAPEAAVTGVSIQQMVAPGVEMIVGARVDPQLGPTVVFGFGGVLVEVLRDVAVRLAPAPEAEVLRALERLRMRPLLDGVRGQPPRDIASFVRLVVRVSHLIADLADLVAEIDINPVILGERGGIAVDGLVIRSA